MYLIHFIRDSKTEIDEFIVICDPEFIDQTKEEYAVDGYKISYVGTLERVSGSETGLPTDRALSEN